MRGSCLLPEGKEGDKLRELAGAILETLSGQKHGGDKEKWSAWLASAYPEVAAKLGGTDGVDVAAWNKRLSSVNWKAGDLERGKNVYARASCAACHSGGQAMGPDLLGAAGRFSRDDLFTAMIRPSKDVPARYRMTQIETTDGKTYQGLIVYEAVDGLILRPGRLKPVHRRRAHRVETRDGYLADADGFARQAERQRDRGFVRVFEIADGIEVIPSHAEVEGAKASRPTIRSG